VEPFTKPGNADAFASRPLGQRQVRAAGHRFPAPSEWAEDNMKPIFLAWVYLIINLVGATALGATLWQLFRLHRELMAILRILRRIDRKIAVPAHQD